MFSVCSTAVCLSTSTQAPPTHWKQVVLWLEAGNRSPVTAGTTVLGKLTYRRLHEENPRDYEITMEWRLSTDQPTAGYLCCSGCCYCYEEAVFVCVIALLLL